MKTDWDVIDAITAYQQSAVVGVASRLGVFDALDDEPHPVDELASTTGTDAGVLGALLDALVSTGLVSRTGDGYASCSALAVRLRRDGDLAKVVRKEAVFARVFLHLDETLRTGKPHLAAWSDRLESEPETAREFLEGIVVFAELLGPDLTTVPELAAAERILDVGGGLGTHARPLAERGASVTLVDLPIVAAWASEALADLPSIDVVAADLLRDPACGVPAGSHDAALVSHLLHDLTDEDAHTALREVVAAVPSGGSVVVVEIPGDVGPGAAGPIFDLTMRLETPGRARSVAELVGMMTSAGLVDVRDTSHPEPVAVLVGTKP